MAITNCCCGGTCGGCRLSSAPNNIAVTISDVTLCKSCMFLPNGGIGKIEGIDQINGTYCAVRQTVTANDAFSCTWIATLVNPVRFLSSSTLACLDTSLQSPLIYIGIRAYNFNTGFNWNNNHPETYPYPNPFYSKIFVWMSNNIGDIVQTQAGTGEGGLWSPFWAYTCQDSVTPNCATVTLPNWNGLGAVCGDTVSLSPTYFVDHYGINSTNSGKGVAGTGGTITIDFSGCCGGTSLSSCSTGTSFYTVDVSGFPTISGCGCGVTTCVTTPSTSIPVAYVATCVWDSNSYPLSPFYYCVKGAQLTRIFIERWQHNVDASRPNVFIWKMTIQFGTFTISWWKSCGDTPAGDYTPYDPSGSWSGCFLDGTGNFLCDWPKHITVS